MQIRGVKRGIRFQKRLQGFHAQFRNSKADDSGFLTPHVISFVKLAVGMRKGAYMRHMRDGGCPKPSPRGHAATLRPHMIGGCLWIPAAAEIARPGPAPAPPHPHGTTDAGPKFDPGPKDHCNCGPIGAGYRLIASE